MQRVFRILILSSILVSCRPGGEGAQPRELNQETPRKGRTNSIEANRAFLKKEVESIKAYIKERGLNLERNGTGIHYSIDGERATGDKVKTGDLVSYSYEISLLNGSKLYESEEGKAAQLLVDREDAEIGLHEALKLMRVGDKGFFILPSHRAFGVAGDQNKVPPYTALVYKLEVLEIQKQNQEK